MLKVLTIHYELHTDGRVTARIEGLPGVSAPLRKDRAEAMRDVKAFALRVAGEEMKAGRIDSETMVLMFEEAIRPKEAVNG